MASSNGFDGYNLAPAFTFPEQQSFANLHSPVDDPLPEPWPPAANKWVFPTTLCIPPDQPGTSQLPAEDQGWPPLDEGYASSSLSPAPDLSWGGIPLPSTTFTGSSRSTAQDNQANQEPYRFGLPAHDGPASSSNYISRPIESFSQLSPEDTPGRLTHRRNRPPSGAEKENPSPIAARDAIDENSFGLRLHYSPRAGAQEWAGASSGLHSDAELLESTQIIAALPTTSQPSRRRVNIADPSSLPASQPTIVPTTSGPTAAARSRRKVPNAVAGPSRLAPITPSETTVEAEATTVIELRRSSRKRTVPANGYAEAAVLPPPPPKKRRAANGTAAKARDSASTMASSAEEYRPVAGPSRQAGKSAASSPAANPSARKARSVAVRTKAKRPRRTRERVDKHKVPDMPSLPCDVVGCTRVWDPYTHDENRKHLQKHFDAGDLESEAGLVCVLDVCQEGVPGKDLLRHMEENHIGLPYLCPIRCGWRASRSSRQTQHMHTAHKGVEWEP
ncbi:hypothetical protein TRAPUB_6925 [Trametes pubescens]|uniref:Uncharacterized protein n=1 Tax=Trametes pubescens TaxID=154538 RepID=A0A1M2V4U6_TRAPU|nr:hypothetical protein TRAPUB_6925 [Trametes pubescens]